MIDRSNLPKIDRQLTELRHIYRGMLSGSSPRDWAKLCAVSSGLGDQYFLALFSPEVVEAPVVEGLRMVLDHGVIAKTLCDDRRWPTGGHSVTDEFYGIIETLKHLWTKCAA